MVPLRYRCIRYKVPIRYLSIHVLHNVPVHVPVPYTSTGLVTGSGTAGTDTLCNGTKNSIKRYLFLYRASIAFVPGQYRFCTGSVSLLCWVSIAFVLGQFCFCIPQQCRLLIAFVPVYTSSCHVCILEIYHCRLVQKRHWYQMFTVLK